MKGSAVAAVLALTALLAACSREPEPPSGITADEAQQLNDAAAMLDANSVDAEVLTNTGQ